jgi:hypothetical protein
MGLNWWFSARRSVTLFAWEQGVKVALREAKPDDRKTATRYTAGSSYPAGEVIWNDMTSCFGVRHIAFRMKFAHQDIHFQSIPPPPIFLKISQL